VETAAAALVADGVLPGSPSFFETMTAIAMLAFAAEPAGSRPVDIAVLEVGMGGRLDATNVVEPLISIITDISLDHMEWLGPTIGAIAREKAGILRTGGTMITLPQHAEANQALGEVAVALGVRGISAADFLPGRDASVSGRNQYLLQGWAGGEGDSLAVDSALDGQHQQRNLALAIAASIELRNSHGYKITNAQIEQGIRTTRWPGRLELISAAKGSADVLLDVAHNPAGAWAVRAALSQFPGEGKRLLIFGCMADKAWEEMAQILFPIFDHIFLTDLPSPRAASSSQLASAAERTGAAYTVCASPDEALAAALAIVSSSTRALVAGVGSVVLVGVLRSLLL
jgi:dihydrofolate synthase/folylpolyglutamate synthase